MAFEQSTATDHYDLLAKLRTFVETTLPVADRYIPLRSITGSYGTVSSITKSGTTATVTMSIPHALNVGERIVIAGASDSLYNIDTTVASIVNATTFTYTMTGTPAADASGSLTLTRFNHEVIWQAPGLSGTEQIYFGVKTYQSITNDYYNWKINAFTGYVPSNTFETQPGRVPNDVGIPMWATTIPYTFVANGQRVIVAANIQNNYQSIYLGKFLPYATPSQYPYPVVVCGTLATNSATRYDNLSYVSWFKGVRTNCSMKFVDGSWRTPEVLPFQTSGTKTLRNTKSVSGNDEVTEPGYYGLHSCILSEEVTNFVNSYGEFEGIYMISGFSNTVENTLVIGGITYLVWRDIGRTGFEDYIAIKLA